MSSAIVEFDVEKMRGVTSSGRVYELRGKPGWNADADCTWAAWRRINNVQAWADVTGEALRGE